MSCFSCIISLGTYKYITNEDSDINVRGSIRETFKNIKILNGVKCIVFRTWNTDLKYLTTLHVLSGLSEGIILGYLPSKIDFEMIGRGLAVKTFCSFLGVAGSGYFLRIKCDDEPEFEVVEGVGGGEEEGGEWNYRHTILHIVQYILTVLIIIFSTVLNSTSLYIVYILGGFQMGVWANVTSGCSIGVVGGGVGGYGVR